MAGWPSQVFAIITAIFGLASFALVLALIEQVGLVACCCLMLFSKLEPACLPVSLPAWHARCFFGSKAQRTPPRSSTQPHECLHQKAAPTRELLNH